MVSPPAPAARRAVTAAVWAAIILTGLVAAGWAVNWALNHRTPPSTASVEQATHLAFPDGTEVVAADITRMQAPAPGNQAEATVDIPAGAFGEFLDANGMYPPLLAESTPDGTAAGTIPAGCTDEVCYTATIIITEDTVTVRLTVTLL